MLIIEIKDVAKLSYNKADVAGDLSQIWLKSIGLPTKLSFFIKIFSNDGEQ